MNYEAQQPFHIESMKSELANAEMKVRQLSVYSNNAIDLLSELNTAFLHNNERYSDKVQNFIKQKPQEALAENDAQVIEKLLYDVNSPYFDPSNIKEVLQKYADDLRNLKCKK